MLVSVANLHLFLYSKQYQYNYLAMKSARESFEDLGKLADFDP